MTETRVPLTSGPMAFLQTALLVDDRVFADRDPAEEPADVDATTVEDPAEEAVLGGTPTPFHPERADVTQPHSDDQRGAGADVHDIDDIDPKPLVEGFAKLGVACVTLAPRETIGADRQRVLAVAANADIVILDWLLRDPGGRQGNRNNPLGRQATTSRNLVRDIVQADEAQGGRLRLLCIYSGNELTDIANQVTDALREVHGDAVHNDLVALTVTAPNLRVVLLAKKTNRGVDGAHVPEGRLAEHLVMEFKTFADGLLRGVALAGLAAVRANAHRLLLRFPCELDAPFLSHRALVGPADADEWATQLITDEIAAAAAGPSEAGQLLDRVAVQQLIDSLLPESAVGRRMLARPTGKKTTPIETGLARRLFEQGKPAVSQQGPKLPDAVEKAASLTQVLYEPDDQGHYTALAAARDDALAVVSCLARDPRHDGPNQVPPVLTLGTVLLTSGSYFLCVQPLCDTVRLEAPTAFPLLPLKLVEEGHSFDLTIPAPGTDTFVRLRSTGARLRDLQLHPFRPEGGSVRAHYREDGPQSGGWYFDTAVELGDAEVEGANQRANEAFLWAGTLRAAQAARAATRLSQSAARPGLLESEYQRVRAAY